MVAVHAFKWDNFISQLRQAGQGCELAGGRPATNGYQVSPDMNGNMAADTISKPPSLATMREEINLFGSLLGETISHIAGEEALKIVERIRKLAWERRTGDPAAAAELVRTIGSLDTDQLRIVIRAFTLFLDILNLAEDRQRVRVLRERRRAAYPGPAGESIRAAVRSLKEDGHSAADMQMLLKRLSIELVFTAHPTDTKRRSVRGKLKRLRQLFEELDLQPDLEQADVLRFAIKGELAKLWQTDLIRPWRPDVMHEVQRGLSIKPVLWEVVPKLCNELRTAVTESYSMDYSLESPPLTFGSWIGGDRDGHPGVTSEVTSQTLSWLRRAAMQFHLDACARLIDSLSISERQLLRATDVVGLIQEATRRWPELQAILDAVPPNELCRKWLEVIRWRLKQTAAVDSLQSPIQLGRYRDATELVHDVRILRDAVVGLPAGELLMPDVQAWLDQIRTFGLHLAKLDVRQDSGRYRQTLDEVLRQTGLCEMPQDLDEVQRRHLLTETLSTYVAIDDGKLSEDSRETIALLRLLHRAAQQFGGEVLGGHVISMTHQVSDVLTVLWLWEHTRPRAETSQHASNRFDIHIIPLFETIDDLARGPRILEELLDTPCYLEQLQLHGMRQTVMLGYSDSTKDGGYVAACWYLYKAQQELQKTARGYGVELTFFHGRGGSLGRGGGPAARSILSLPYHTFRGSLRLTEQGEVLADRYDDPHIARRHLEQVVWSSLLAGAGSGSEAEATWTSMMDDLASTSLEHYRQLVEHPGFVSFFRSATPISEIEQLPIGSRPSRRRPSGGLSDLRAIPWVFSWTQCRCLIPAWYGLGTAMVRHLADNETLAGLKTMYADWPFFRAMIDNAELALAKTDIDIANRYFALVEDSQPREEIGAQIAEEYEKSRKALLALTGSNHLLERSAWLRESIRVRDRYIDPLNLSQVELLRRRQASQVDDEELRHLTRLTVNGIAAGLRTSG